MLESKRRAIIFFSIAIVLAGTSGFLVLQKVQALNSNLGTMVQVFVANENISSRDAITPNNIRTEEIPQKYLRDEHITNEQDLMNKVTVVPLSEGDVITKNLLKQVSTVTEEDNRLITMMSSERVTFDEPLLALDRVDIIVSHEFEGESKTEVFMEDVKVAKVAKKDGEFAGVQVEVPFEKVPRLIHMQNYADSTRIVKANVGQSAAAVQQEKQSEEEKPKDEKKEEQSTEEDKETKEKQDGEE
ncbi:Flp pilus assembly protein CpaB [Pontibacillus salipaludis]|uniref:Flp pilus assembly protein CpaB n=1 Tax=Pontibacillus salipaludis TaxID=1697394 RepID=UPI0031ECBEBE